MPYQPTACARSYRLVIVRKNLAIEKGEQRLFDDYRYFYYLTNDWEKPAIEIVFRANGRCNQENLNAQLKGAVRALTAPVDNLESNWAYMVMVSLAWNLKAWWRYGRRRPGDGGWNVFSTSKRPCCGWSSKPSSMRSCDCRARLFKRVDGSFIACSVGMRGSQCSSARSRNYSTDKTYRSRSLDAPVRRGIAGTSWSGRKVKISNSRMDYRTPPRAWRFPAPTELLEIHPAT